MLKVIALVGCDLKRVIRRKWWIALLALPILLALVRIIWSNSAFSIKLSWTGPIACALLTFAVMVFQEISDRISGFSTSLATTPITYGTITTSRAIAGLMIFMGQMIVFAAIVSVRFG